MVKCEICIYKGFKTWLSNTLSWIRSVGKDMGDAAADLGKSVANKAIAGLKRNDWWY